MLTVQNILELPPLAGIEVLAAAQGLGRIVQRTVVIEVPEVLGQLQEGDLLMTSVDTFLPHKEVFVEMLDTLSQRRVAGLLIKGRFPGESAMYGLVVAANRNCLPLLNIQRQISYSEIIMAFATDLLERQRKLMHRSEGLRRRFLSAMVAGGGLQHIASLLSKEVGGNGVVMTNANHRRLIGHCELHPGCDTLTEDIEHQQTFVDLNDKLAISGQGLPGEIIDSAWETRWLRWTVTVDNFRLGYVYLYGCKRALRQSDTIVLEQASALVALELLKHRTRLDVEQRRTDFVHGLTKGKHQVDETTTQVTRALGWQMLLPVQLLVFGTRGDLPPALKTNDLERLTAELLPARNYQDIFWPCEDCLVLVHSVERHLAAGQYREHGLETAMRLQDALSRRLGVEFFAGIGQIVENVSQIPLSYAQARQSLLLGRSLPEGRVMHFNDMGIYQILLQHPNSDYLREFMLQTLGPLIQHDLETDSQLVHTLHVYLAHDRNIRSSALQLDLHYNSMRYRLQRITEILGLGWDKPSVRLNIEISLKILSLQVPSMHELASLASRF